MCMPSPNESQVEVWVLGPLPPPVTGMTLLTQQIVAKLQECGPITMVNWSPGFSRKGIRFRSVRICRVLKSLLHLLRRGRVENGRLYLVSNSNWGLYFTAILVFCARRLGYQIYLHHHVYSYIDRYDWRMSWIDWLIRDVGVHIVHCEKMVEDFRDQYGTSSRFTIVCPSVVSIPLGKKRFAAHRPFRLGHLSNLTIAKGLVTVLDTFHSLRRMGQNVCLELAGPVQSGEASRVLQQTLLDYPELVKYWGPLFGKDKSQFFSEIDVFLFPTQYESWGIVLNEALAAGVPVITYDRGCTRVVVGERAGLIVHPNQKFTEMACRQICRWIASEEEYRAASQAAIEQADYLHREGERTLSQFVHQMFSLVLPENDKLPMRSII